MIISLLKSNKYLRIGILALSIILIQILTTIGAAEYYLTQLTMSAYYVLTALGLCLLMGYAGQISLGQAGFFAIGGYTTAVLTSVNLSDRGGEPVIAFLQKIGILVSDIDLYGNALLYISPYLALLCALLITLLAAAAIGRPVLKLKGHYLAMATLGFGIIVYRTVLGTPLFGEADGITGLPAFRILPGLSVSGDFSSRVSNYYIAWILVIIAVLILENLIDSRPGRALRSLHGKQEASQAVGINISRYKLNVFILGALFAAVAGVFSTHYNGGIGPTEASSVRSVRFVAIVALGGMANLWGTLIAGSVLSFLSLRGVFGSYDDAVFGIILIVVMVFGNRKFFKLEAIKNRLTSIVKGSGEKASGRKTEKTSRRKG